MTAETQKEIVSWIKVILAAILSAFIISNFIIVHATVPTGSMLNTIPEHSRIIASRLSYMFSDPKRFDVVVFKYPDDESVLFVKRVIGLPGDTLNIIDGKVYINGSSEPLDDSFVKEPPLYSFGPYEIPEGHYFMMGDNRNNSEDSRRWNNKYLSKDKIIGKLVLTYYPDFKFIK